MTTTSRKSGKPKGGRKARSTSGLTLPGSTTTVEIGGVSYFITPTRDMQEWLEEMEDILDSRKAMEEPGKSVTFDQVAADLGLKIPNRRGK